MTVPAEYALLIDASKWQTAVDYLLWRNGGVECIIGKISQGSYGQDPQRLQHCLGAKSNGMHYAGYHWADPMSGDKAQVDNLIRAAEPLEPEFICVDVEQYWSDWSEYSSKHITKFISPQRISDNAQYCVERIRERTGLRVLMYTRPWFILEWSPQILTWYWQHPMWWAQYTTDQVDLHTTWDNLKQSWLPKTKNPTFPKQWTTSKNWEIWQWSGDKFILPGCSTCLDVNYIKRSFLGETIPPPEPPPLPEEIIVNTSTLNIRTLPQGTIIGTTTLGKTLKVEGAATDPSGNIWYKVQAYVAGWLTKPK